MAGGAFVSTGPAKEYPGRLTLFVFLTCVVAATGGLIFGYDIGISGGVTSMDPFLSKFFPDVYRKEKLDKSTNQYCKFDSQVLTTFTSSLYLAALIASFFASWVTRVMGRKWSTFGGGITFLVGATLNGAAQNVLMLILGRILLGIGIGFANQSVPVYRSEMAPAKLRGMLNIGFQLMITIGILAANLINYGTDKMKGGAGWRVSLALAAVPAAIITAGSLFLPDTPNSLIERGHDEKAKRMLRRIRGIEDVHEEYTDHRHPRVQPHQLRHRRDQGRSGVAREPVFLDRPLASLPGPCEPCYTAPASPLPSPLLHCLLLPLDLCQIPAPAFPRRYFRPWPISARTH